MTADDWLKAYEAATQTHCVVAYCKDCVCHQTYPQLWKLAYLKDCLPNSTYSFCCATALAAMDLQMVMGRAMMNILGAVFCQSVMQQPMQPQPIQTQFGLMLNKQPAKLTRQGRCF